VKFRYALIPGRHQSLTAFQGSYLQGLLDRDTSVTGFSANDQIDRQLEFIWAVTSANHGGTRRNPLSGERRLGMIEHTTATVDLPSHVYLINNMQPKADFAHYVIEDVRMQSRGRIDLTPENCIVVCSTPSVIKMYRGLGYTIADAELDESTGKARGIRPWDVVEEIIASGSEWRSNAMVRAELHPTCFEYYERYGLGDAIVEVFGDPLIDSEDGDITDTRDYATYRQAFEDNAWRKVDAFADYVRPGRILDVGCATGQTLKLLGERPDLFESDFYGVEAARPLYQICEQRKSNGDFGSTNTFFYQRNIMRSSLFAKNSLDSIITMALTHEIESYLGTAELRRFVGRMYDMLAPGGVYINYDVVGPDDKDAVVYALLTDDDGENPEDVANDLEGGQLTEWLASLSTKARFRRFAQDFRASEGDKIEYTFETIDDREYAVLRRADLCDFLAKKDYIDSWTSEMHERFCFFEHADWVELLESVGFEVAAGTEAIQNPWLIENRFAPAAQVFTMHDNQLVLEPQPVTNTLLVMKKPE